VVDGEAMDGLVLSRSASSVFISSFNFYNFISSFN